MDFVEAAGLAETLSGPGPFTVVAPTNEAFAKVAFVSLLFLLPRIFNPFPMVVFHKLQPRIELLYVWLLLLL